MSNTGSHTGATASSSTDDGPECLLRHANEVRKHANLDSLDAFLSQSGYSWIEMMISHAKDSYEGYQSSSALHRSNSQMAQAFEHKMAAELLKTPSPKKPKRIAALHHKFHPSKPQQTSSNDPFSDENNKENRSAILPSSPKKEVIEESIKLKEGPNPITRNTRSKGDQSELVQLPNPFQPRALQSKEQGKQRPKMDEMPAPKPKEPKKASTKTKVKAKSDVSKKQVEEKGELVEKIKIQKVSNDLKKDEKDQVSIAPTTTAHLPQNAEPIDFIDDSQEVEYSLQVVKNVEEKTQVAKKPNLDAILTSSPKVEDAKVIDNKEDDFEEIEDTSITRDLRNGRYESSSPRESTPPPLSPTKAQRAEHTLKARERLEKSLMKLVSDDEESDEEETEAEKEIVVEAAHKVDSKPSKEKMPNPLDEKHLEAEKVDNSDPQEEQIKDEAKSVQASAPKRTLSSMAHAKKSIVGSSSSTRPHGRGSSMVPSAASSGAKTSFLSKSIMRVEQDQQSLEDDSIEFAVASSSPSSKPAKSESKKRKSDEANTTSLQAPLPVKAAKIAGKGEQKENKATSTLKSTTSKQNQEEEEKQNVATSTQMQSLREKIESFNTNKNVTNGNGSSAQTKSTRTFSSMSTHSVGLGATKISSPMFSRSNSQNTIAPEPQSPTREEKIAEEPKQTNSIPVSTTPINSPGPASNTLYPNVNLLQQQQSPIKPREGIVEEKETSDDLSEGGYDTSTDGELSLNDLIGNTPAKKTNAKVTTTAPRPPGTNLRATSALPKTATSAKSSAFMPSSATNGKNSRPVSRLGKPLDDQSGTSAISSASSQATATSGTTTSSLSSSIHATWGGSISSKLKGILGFSSTSPQKNNTTAHQMSASTNTKPSSVNGKSGVTIPVRKDSVLSSTTGGAGSRTGTVSSISSVSTFDKRPASAIKSDLIRKKEAEQAEKRAKEKEERNKASAALVAAAESAKKRVREENATKVKPPSSASATSRPVPPQPQQSRVGNQMQSEAKKRKSNEGAAIPVKTSTVTKQASSQALKATMKTAQATQSKATTSKMSTNPQNGVFSDHNPFQKAQTVQQNQALAAVSQQMQMHKAKKEAATVAIVSPDTKLKMAATGHIELEEPDSAYSDSDDEETIQKRLQHKPWETRDGLASALEAQAAIDADLIFGIPQGAVPLDDILPAQSDHARARRMRPRSSSATWSRDGLKQFEIDRYNERMGIKGPGVLLANTNMAGNGMSRDDGSGTPSRAGRMSALAQSAIAQGQVSHKKQRP